MSGFSPYPYATAFDQAAAYLAKGRNKLDRPLGNNTRLRRIDAATIAVVYHHTAVVTYHSDATITIYGGHWNTVTTKARISGYSPSRPGSDGHGGWIVGWTGEHTAPKVQKCRTCKHRGTWMENDHCYGPSQWGEHWCHGGQYKAVDGRYERVACEHGNTNGHATAPCQHGQWERHITGQSQRSCHRCHGTGMADYGSNPIAIKADAGTPYKVDADGTFISVLAVAPKATPSATASEPSVNTFGSTIVDRLASVVPGIYDQVQHPIDGTMAAVYSIVINLNDSRGWSRERIADWLDTLDANLRFTPAALARR